MTTSMKKAPAELQPIVFSDDDKAQAFNEVFGEFIAQLLPENFAIIEQQLAEQPALRAQFTTILRLIADLIGKHDNVDELEEEVNNMVAQLNAALEASEDAFYENPEVVSARTELYSLKSGFDHGKQGKELQVIVVDKDEWFAGGNTYSNRCKQLINNRHKKFRGRMVPRYIATTWAMKKTAAFANLRDFAAGVLSQVVDSIPHFPTDDLQLKYLNISANAVGGATPKHAYGIVLNSHANVGAMKSRKDRSPLPVPAHLAFAQRSAAGKIGIVISGNTGAGMLFEEDRDYPVVRYSRDEFALREAFKSHGVICLIGSDVRARTTTLIGNGVMSDIPGSDCQITMCHQFFQLGVDLVDGDWTPAKKKELQSQIMAYLESLYDINNGDRFLSKPVEKKDIDLFRNPETGEVTIKVNIQVKRAIEGVAILVDPTIPNRSKVN